MRNVTPRLSDYQEKWMDGRPSVELYTMERDNGEHLNTTKAQISRLEASQVTFKVHYHPESKPCKNAEPPCVLYIGGVPEGSEGG